MNTIKTFSRTIAAIVLLTTIFTSCKKNEDTTTPTTVSGSASASVKIGSGTSADVAFSSAIFTNVSGTVDVVATAASGAKLVFHLTGVTAAGVFNLTGSNTAVYTAGGVIYTTAGSGGGNVTITALSADKVEGTFNVESFAGTVYCSLSSGKFTAGK